ncbi:GYD domain-containing protein [Aliiruegeria lutimaris]|uniref:Uncharacterized protein, contains GYD domain n=1 Tax=Aliiruegeria lutimaris TaxID=571298 RepID=A0A1G9GVU1_9RHOB|nr:GYD domain-containing protein [Aliiruegeria lutimaris]SDL04799.1 Uncharacterized protein, contains GYD domain [Aliiruegeria lutimaris]
MPRYILTAKLTQAAIKGFIAKGDDRKPVLEKLVSSAGGTLVEHYFITGDADVMLILDADSVDVPAKAAMIVGAAGIATDFNTHCVWSTAEFAKLAGEAGKASASYTPPGS